MHTPVTRDLVANTMNDYCRVEVFPQLQNCSHACDLPYHTGIFSGNVQLPEFPRPLRKEKNELGALHTLSA